MSDGPLSPPEAAAAPADGPTQLEEHLTFYIDFLGFKDAVEANDWARLGAIAAVLHGIARQRGVFEHRIVREGATSAQHFYKAATTTFSDHVVFSYPMQELAESALRPVGILVGLTMARPVVASLALAALRVGMLIRGGVALGGVLASVM